LTKGQVDIVKGMFRNFSICSKKGMLTPKSIAESLVGSILSNLLLVMGMCFFFGGLNRIEQHFNVTVAQTASSLLALAAGSLIIPAAFQAWADGSRELSHSKC